VEQRLRRHGKPGAGDIMRRWFVTGVWDRLIDNDDVCVRSSSRAQMFQYRETIFISPVVQYHPQEVHRNFFLLGSLRFKEILDFQKGPKVNPRFWESGGESDSTLESHAPGLDSIRHIRLPVL
jgi:hypothetical protein